MRKYLCQIFFRLLVRIVSYFGIVPIFSQMNKTQILQLILAMYPNILNNVLKILFKIFTNEISNDYYYR